VLSNLGVSLLAAGRPRRAGELLEQAAALRDRTTPSTPVPELARAAGIWDAITTPREPTVRLDPPVPGPDMSVEGARQLQAAAGGAADTSLANPLSALERALGVAQHHDAIGPGLDATAFAPDRPGGQRRAVEGRAAADLAHRETRRLTAQPLRIDQQVGAGREAARVPDPVQVAQVLPAVGRLEEPIGDPDQRIARHHPVDDATVGLRARLGARVP
jgi:hypothetical protein